MHTSSALLVALAHTIVLTTSAPSFAQTLTYKKFDVGNRVSITVPSHWYIRDAAGRQNIAAYADAALDPTGKSKEPIHYSSLSALSSSENPQVILRVSFVQETGSQSDLQQYLKNGRAAALSELAAGWQEESAKMAVAMKRQGGQYLGDERFDFIEIGGKQAILISYKRASLTGGAPYRVTQYHVPMGTDKVLITTSFQESAARLMQPIVDRIKASITILR